VQESGLPDTSQLGVFDEPFPANLKLIVLIEGNSRFYEEKSILLYVSISHVLWIECLVYPLLQSRSSGELFS
jgi:hypothetical protein